MANFSRKAVEPDKQNYSITAATMARPGCGDRYVGLAEGNDDKESIDRSLEPPIYMLVSLVNLIC